jgi:hypothetical protein
MPEEPTATGGPNGREDWLNCGLFDEGGWQPPYLRMDQSESSFHPFKALPFTIVN